MQPETFKFAKRKLRVCVCVWICECTSRNPRRSESPYSLDTELQMAVSYLVWMLRTELGSSERAATALTTEHPTSPFPFNRHSFHSAQEFPQMSRVPFRSHRDVAYSFWVSYASSPNLLSFSSFPSVITYFCVGQTPFIHLIFQEMNSSVNIDQSFQFNFQFLLPAPYLVLPCFARIYLNYLCWVLPG